MPANTIHPDRLTDLQTRVLVAVITCERAEHGLPCRRAIADVAGNEDDSLPSRMATAGWLESVPNPEQRGALYRATEKGHEWYARKRREVREVAA